MNIYTEEFETWFKARFWHECYEDVKHHLFAAWQASREAVVIEMQPEWHLMSELPPFPFRGDIYSEGKLIIGADWAGGGLEYGYWQSPKGDRSIERVSHWKHSNSPIEPPKPC